MGPPWRPAGILGLPGRPMNELVCRALPGPRISTPYGLSLALPRALTLRPCPMVNARELMSQWCAKSSSGTVLRIGHYYCCSGVVGTLYPGPVLNVGDQHSQSCFHCIPQELVCLPLPGRGKRKQCVSSSKSRGHTSYAAPEGMCHQLRRKTVITGCRMSDLSRLLALPWARLLSAAWG